MSTLEHCNINVSNPDRTAQLLSELFDWKVRWAGDSMNRGYTVHIGSNESYLALYTNENLLGVRANEPDSDQGLLGGLNHIGIEVDDLDRVKNRAIKLGYEPYNFGSYEPGDRFYINLHSYLEVEVISYRERRPLR